MVWRLGIEVNGMQVEDRGKEAFKKTVLMTENMPEVIAANKVYCSSWP